MVIEIAAFRLGRHPVLVQIYETVDPEEGAALARLGVDHVGVLVGEGEFPRERSPAQARAIFAALPPATRCVALSLSADAARIAGIVEACRPDIVHVGAATELFSPEDTQALKARFPGVALMRSIPVVDAGSVALARAYEGIADFLLLDSHSPGDRQIGALGRTHDWSVSRRIVESVALPAILAGGLGPDNVDAAIRAVQPAGVDSKTRTDAPDGEHKDLAKVAEFVRRARAVELPTV